MIRLIRRHLPSQLWVDERFGLHIGGQGGEVLEGTERGGVELSKVFNPEVLSLAA